MTKLMRIMAMRPTRAKASGGNCQAIFLCSFWRGRETFEWVVSESSCR
jgi:hypothetical protein